MVLVITDDGFEVWYALWQDVLDSDQEEGQRMAFGFVADCLRRAGLGHDREYLAQRWWSA